MNNNKISADSLDFNSIKQNFKEFLGGQEQFKDYNFEGSNMSVLLDLLAFNTYYNGLYNNMVLNESFLDSASKRTSVVSAVTPLGYIPKSYSASKAIVNLRINYPTDKDQLILFKGHKFTSTIDDNTYTFVTGEDRISFRNANGVFDFGDITILSGNYVTQTFICDGKTPYIINNATVDTTTVKVTVYPNATNPNGKVFTLSDNITSLKPTDAVFFMKENESGLYELEFGDGVICQELSYGSIVLVEYVATQTTNPDGCNHFMCQMVSLDSSAKPTVRTVSPAVGWGEKESIESIKFNAPKYHNSQNRCVTPDDFCTVARRGFPNIKSIIGWGGEDNIPFAANTTFLCVKPSHNDILTPNEKLILINDVLLPKAYPDAKVQIVDPEYLNLIIDSTVFYNSKSTNDSASTISDIIKSNIISYVDSVGTFGGLFRYSPMTTKIDGSNSSIKNNITTVRLYKTVTPKINVNGRYKINIGNSIEPSEGSVATTGFFTQDTNDVYYISDDGNGLLYTYYILNGLKVMGSTIGSVDYANGIVTIDNLNVAAINTSDFKFLFIPTSYDIVSVKNQILRVASSDVKVTIVDEAYSKHQSTTIHI